MHMYVLSCAVEGLNQWYVSDISTQEDSDSDSDSPDSPDEYTPSTERSENQTHAGVTGVLVGALQDDDGGIIYIYP